MAIEFEPENLNCVSFGVASKTWYQLAEESGISDLIDGYQRTTDPISIDADTAKDFAILVEGMFIPSEGWFSPGKEEEGKQMFIDFFNNCGGFTTS